jgi:hypothetical protein
MDQNECNAQMNRLGAAYRIDVPAGTRAAYFLAFQKTRAAAFATACALAIEQERMFPSIATIKEILKLHHETSRAATPALPESTESEEADYLAVLERDRAEIEALAPYREEQSGRPRYVPVAVPLNAAPPPEGFVEEVRGRIGHVPIPTCFTPFVIVPKKRGGRAGFVAQWANTSERSPRRDATDWRETREAVRQTMVNLYADVQA